MAAVAGAAGLLLVLVTWAASIGPDDVLRKPGRQAGSSFIVQPSQSASNGIDLNGIQRAHHHSSSPPAWLKLAAILFEVLAFVAVVYVAWRLARLALVAWRGRRRLQTRDGERVEFDVKHGPVTTFGIAQRRDGAYQFVASAGTVVPGPLLKIGNTTSRVDFGCDPGEWTDAWSATGISHHWALGTGNLLPELRATAELLGTELAEVAAPARNEDL